MRFGTAPKFNKLVIIYHILVELNCLFCCVVTNLRIRYNTNILVQTYCLTDSLYNRSAAKRAADKVSRFTFSVICPRFRSSEFK